jgi:signal transduction histidine kinase
MFTTLLIVALVALLGGARPAATAVVVGLVAQEVLFTFPYGLLMDHEPAQLSILFVFVALGVGIGLIVDELVRLSAEQAALRRIATLVARGTRPVEVFSAVANEVAALLAADAAVVEELEPDGAVTVRAVGGARADGVAVGDRLPVKPLTVLATVVRTRRPARVDDRGRPGPGVRARIRRLGIRSSVGAPIVVGGRLWGVLVASGRRGWLSSDAEQRLLDFTEIVATSIADSETRSELAASRARIVAASDEARRRIERDLHDGVQQRLVSLALDVRAAQSALPPGSDAVRAELSHVVEGLTGSLDQLREISRGIHPSILAEGGLGPALRALARRAPVPVRLDVRADVELTDGVKVAAYYAVSEMLTNTAKHAQASRLDVIVASAGGALRLVARDDGVGGADPARGSGLVGLRDRVEALGGAMTVSSPPGEGTTIELALPFGGQHVPQSAARRPARAVP